MRWMSVLNRKKMRGAFVVAALAATGVMVGTGSGVSSAVATTPTWTQQTTVSSPPIRFQSSLAYDAAHSKVVMFGGQDLSIPAPHAVYNDTWTFNGTNWTQVIGNGAMGSPPGRYGATMVYDASIGKTVLFGGYSLDADHGVLNDTWTFDGTSWLDVTAGSITPTNTPNGRGNASMAYDTVHNNVVLFGGWKDQTVPAITGATGTTVTFMAAHGLVVGDQLTLSGATPAGWNGTWTVASVPTTTTATLTIGALAATTVQPTGVVGYVNDTWVLNGTSWSKVKANAAVGNPDFRWGGAMTWDGANNRVLLHGGNSVNGLANDTWEWDGTNWTQVMTATSPPARYGAALAYDGGHGEVVLFGGTNGSNPTPSTVQAYADTWQFDGANWAQVTPATPPSARYFTQAVYDTTIDRVVLWGGANSATTLQDTWLFTQVVVAPPPTSGYWLAASDGGIFTYGNAGFHGSAGALTLNKPIVGMASTPSGNGYWLVASDGGIFTYGDAGYYGSTGAIALNKPIVGMASTPSGHGYWLVATDGGIFTFGDASFLGSTGALTLNKPIVGMSPTPTGDGYWLVASDGGIFTFGHAAFYGSTGAITLNKPILGMAPTVSGHGYWLVASDGGIFTFGDAPFLGSAGAITLNKPIIGMARHP